MTRQRWRMVIVTVLALAGLIMIMGAAGSVDYAFETGTAGPSIGLTAVRGIVGIAALVLAGVVYGGER